MRSACARSVASCDTQLQRRDPVDVSSLAPWWVQRGWNVRRPAGQEVDAGGSRWAAPAGALEGTGGGRSTAGSPPWPRRDLGTVAGVAAAGPSERSSSEQTTPLVENMENDER